MPSLMAEATVGDGLKYIGVGLTSIGFMGASVGQGNVAQSACMAIGRNPEMASKITSTMIIGAGIIESGSIYALIVAILLIFVV